MKWEILDVTTNSFDHRREDDWTLFLKKSPEHWAVCSPRGIVIATKQPARPETIDDVLAWADEEIAAYKP